MKYYPHVLGVGLMFLCTLALAESRALSNTPVYNPETKSYFELIKLETRELSIRNAPEATWEKARLFAMTRIYKGVRGQLAVVDSPATDEFLRTTFRSNKIAWIGLRYLCTNRQLQWVTGKVLRRGDYKRWDPKWDRSSNANCSRGAKVVPYMPVAYTPVSEGFRWIAKGTKKEYRFFFVEYATREK